MRNLYFFILAFAVSAPALGADTRTAAAQAAADNDKPICRRETPVGSLIASRKMCLTKAQWAERERDGNEAARRLVAQGTGRCMGAGAEC